MKRNNLVLWVVLGLVAVLLIWVWNSYNGLVDKQLSVDESYAQVQTDYQRRADLIPNLVKTVKAGAKNEKEILENVTAARAGIQNAKSPAQLDAAGAQINRAINIVMEAYPQIRGTELFGKLMNDLEGTENRIKESRKDYNRAVKTYNSSTKKFPGNIIASWFDFEPKEFFEATAGSEKAPELNFE
jgi:LemA protein